jgi:hypothetical protein
LAGLPLQETGMAFGGMWQRNGINFITVAVLSKGEADKG